MTHDPKDTTPEESATESEAWAEVGLAWRSKNLEAPLAMNASDVARRARKFAWSIVWRNTRELLACVALVAWAMHDAFGRSSWVERLPSLSMAVAALWVGAYLVLRGRNLSPPPPTATTDAFLAYERTQLERQRRLLLGVRRWYLGPLLVPIFLMSSILFLKMPDHWSAVPLAVVGVFLSAAVAVFACVDRLNMRAAKQLSETLKALGG